MPIRTNRGRAAVYRRLWGWPLRSPRHLAVVIVFVLAVVLFLSTVLPQVTGSGSRATQNTGASVSASPPPGSSARTQGAPGVVPPVTGGSAGQGGGQSPQSPSLTETRLSPSQNLTPARADPKALDTAARWAAAFVNHPDGISAQDWLNPMRELTTEEYFSTRLSTIDPKSVTASRIRSGPVATAESYTSSVTAEIATDAKKLSITVIRTGAGWRVNEHTEVE